MIYALWGIQQNEEETQMYVCGPRHFQFINKQEAREKGLCVLLPPASFWKANPERLEKCQKRRRVLRLSERGMK